MNKGWGWYRVTSNACINGRPEPFGQDCPFRSRPQPYIS